MNMASVALVLKTLAWSEATVEAWFTLTRLLGLDKTLGTGVITLDVLLSMVWQEVCPTPCAFRQRTTIHVLDGVALVLLKATLAVRHDLRTRELDSTKHFFYLVGNFPLTRHRENPSLLK